MKRRDFTFGISATVGETAVKSLAPAGAQPVAAPGTPAEKQMKRDECVEALEKPIAEKREKEQQAWAAQYKRDKGIEPTAETRTKESGQKSQKYPSASPKQINDCVGEKEQKARAQPPPPTEHEQKVSERKQKDDAQGGPTGSPGERSRKAADEQNQKSEQQSKGEQNKKGGGSAPAPSEADQKKAQEQQKKTSEQQQKAAEQKDKQAAEQKQKADANAGQQQSSMGDTGLLDRVARLAGFRIV